MVLLVVCIWSGTTNVVMGVTDDSNGDNDDDEIFYHVLGVLLLNKSLLYSIDPNRQL